MTSRAVQRYIALLMESRNQAHAYHLTTTSYAEHKALQKYYEGIVPLFDSYAEAYMGKNGRLGRISLIRRRSSPKDPRVYFRTLVATIRRMKLPRNTALRSIQDDIMVLIRSTMYMLHLH
jgi:hypothetical protein